MQFFWKFWLTQLIYLNLHENTRKFNLLMLGKPQKVIQRNCKFRIYYWSIVSFWTSNGWFLYDLSKFIHFSQKVLNLNQETSNFRMKMAENLCILKEWSNVLLCYSSKGWDIYESYTDTESPRDDLSNKPTFAKIHQRIADF